MPIVPLLISSLQILLGYIVCIYNGSVILIWFILTRVIYIFVIHVPVSIPLLRK